MAVNFESVGAAVPLSVGVARCPSNAMWPGPRPTAVPSFILIHPTIWPQYTNVTDRTAQWSDSIGQTVLQMVAQKQKGTNTSMPKSSNKRLSYRRGTAQCSILFQNFVKLILCHTTINNKSVKQMSLNRQWQSVCCKQRWMLSVITCDDRIKMTTLYVVSKETPTSWQSAEFPKTFEMKVLLFLKTCWGQPLYWHHPFSLLHTLHQSDSVTKWTPRGLLNVNIPV